MYNIEQRYRIRVQLAFIIIFKYIIPNTTTYHS